MTDDWLSSSEGSIDSYDTSSDSDLTPVQIPWLALSVRTAVNLFIPFVNGIMLGFGEILAHELGLFYGWRSARVYDPLDRQVPRPARRSWLWPF